MPSVIAVSTESKFNEFKLYKTISLRLIQILERMFVPSVIDEWNRLPEIVLHCSTLSTRVRTVRLPETSPRTFEIWTGPVQDH